MPVDKSVQVFDAERPCLIIKYDHEARGEIWRLVDEDGGVCQSMVGFSNEDAAVAAARRYLHERYLDLPVYVAVQIGSGFWGWTDE